MNSNYEERAERGQAALNQYEANASINDAIKAYTERANEGYQSDTSDEAIMADLVTDSLCAMIDDCELTEEEAQQLMDEHFAKHPMFLAIYDLPNVDREKIKATCAIHYLSENYDQL